MSDTTLTIVCKKSDNKAFKGSDDSWYNLNDNVIPCLEKMNKGDKITIEYTKKGVSRYVSKLTSAGAVETETETPKSVSSTGYACEVCGKELKDGKFKKCFMCNKTGAVKKDEAKSGPSESGAGKSTFRPYDNPEKSAQIQRGNALNAAAAVASGQQFADPDVAKQFTLLLAEDFLNWLRAE
jgi:hypothetical protein